MLIVLLLVFSVSALADNHEESIDAEKSEAVHLDAPSDNLAEMCAYLEQHILNTHARIVDIDTRNNAARDAGVNPSRDMANASSSEWAHQAQDASIYGNLRCFERSALKSRYENANRMMNDRRARAKERKKERDKGWFD
jgi:uncharacterized protein YunC (DUF1805 family)